MRIAIALCALGLSASAAGAASAESKWFACSAHVEGKRLAISEAFQFDAGGDTDGSALQRPRQGDKWAAPKANFELHWLRYLQGQYKSVTAAGCYGPYGSGGEARSQVNGMTQYNETTLGTGWVD